MSDFLPVVLAVVTVLSGEPGIAAPHVVRPSIARDAHTLLTAIDRPVRAADQDIQRLIARGMARSRTFAGLVAALDRTDVIVYVETNNRMPQRVAGRLLFGTASSGGPRYLRVQIARDASSNSQIAAIAHELQHALEVAEAPEVRDEAGLERYYRRIGIRGALERSYDTAAAQLTGRRVRMEVDG